MKRIWHVFIVLSRVSRRISIILLALSFNAASLGSQEARAAADGRGFPAFFPEFSWQTVPVYQMFGDKELLADAAVKEIASTSNFICIEKAHGITTLAPPIWRAAGHRAAEGSETWDEVPGVFQLSVRISLHDPCEGVRPGQYLQARKRNVQSVSDHRPQDR